MGHLKGLTVIFPLNPNNYLQAFLYILTVYTSLKSSH